MINKWLATGLGIFGLTLLLYLIFGYNPTPILTPYANWHVTNGVLADGITAWGTDDMNNAIGSTFTLNKDDVSVGNNKCNSKVTPVKEDREFLTSVKNPCGSDVAIADSKKVFAVDIADDCQSMRLPPYLALLSDGRAVMFGDGVSFCLKSVD